MRKKILPQEALKLIACITMLIDHFGAAIVPMLSISHMARLYYICRMIGRIAFPVYAFLLAEGMRHTRNPKKYILRLAVGILLAELPFDLLFEGGFTWASQSVMVTLTLGAMMLLCMQLTENKLLKQLIVLLFAVVAEFACCDYGMWGILMVAVFELTDRFPLQLLCVLLINWLIPSADITVFGLKISIQLLGVFAMVPIALYSGQKLTRSPVIQWGFYLFYPLHLLALWLILTVMR